MKYWHLEKIKWHRGLQEARYAKSHLGSRIQIWNLGIHADDIVQQGLNSEMSKMPRQRSLDQQVCVCVCCVLFVIVMVKF